jgi:protein-disulfide isomerase
MRMWKILIGLGGLLALGAAGLATNGMLALDDTAHAVRAPKDAGDAGTATPETLTAASAGDLAQVQPGDHVLGDPDAPVTIVEYSSLTCPHCATFHKETLPRIKKNFIEPGQVKLIFRHYPLDRRALKGALLTECFDGRRFFSMLNILYMKQMQWARAEDPEAHFRKLAGMAGLSPEKADACMNDSAKQDRILQRQLDARRGADIQATPSFIIDGEVVEGNPGYDELAQKLREAGA